MNWISDISTSSGIRDPEMVILHKWGAEGAQGRGAAQTARTAPLRWGGNSKSQLNRQKSSNPTILLAILTGVRKESVSLFVITPLTRKKGKNPVNDHPPEGQPSVTKNVKTQESLLELFFFCFYSAIPEGFQPAGSSVTSVPSLI